MFKKGDKVRCIESKNAPLLSHNKCYVIEDGEVSSTHVKVDGLWYKIGRFELVDKKYWSFETQSFTYDPEFKIGRDVKYVGPLRVNVPNESIWTVTKILDNDIMVYNESTGRHHIDKKSFFMPVDDMFSLNGLTVDDEFKSKAFSLLNYNDAREYIGKKMEFADPEGVLLGKWYKAILKDVYFNEYPFLSDVSGEEFGFVRTYPDTFKKDNSGLIEALKKTIIQLEETLDELEDE